MSLHLRDREEYHKKYPYIVSHASPVVVARTRRFGPKYSTSEGKHKKDSNNARLAADRRSRERKCDKWTLAMERSLRSFQPACVLCDIPNDLTTHHVRPLIGGHGLEPGNAVRLCRGCNSFIWIRPLSDLSTSQSNKLEMAAARFKEHWENGAATPSGPHLKPDRGIRKSCRSRAHLAFAFY